MNMPLLLRLRAANGEFIMLRALGADLAATRRDLDELMTFGFELEVHPLHGVAFRGPSQRLCPDQIEYGLGTRLIGRRLAVWDRVSSTNDLALRAASSRANEGLVVLAESQHQGRGRRGRSWSAPHGTSILMSFLVFPPELRGCLDGLTALGAVAVAEVVEKWTGFATQIKWPNDVRVQGKKLAGVLVEVDRTGGVVIGIGLNVNLPRSELPDELADITLSMADLTKKTLDRSEVVRDLIRRLDDWYHEELNDQSSQLAAAWKSRSEHPGTIVCVETEQGSIEGLVIDLDLKEGLILERPDQIDLVRIPAILIRSMTARKLLESSDPD